MLLFRNDLSERLSVPLSQVLYLHVTLHAYGTHPSLWKSFDPWHPSGMINIHLLCSANVIYCRQQNKWWLTTHKTNIKHLCGCERCDFTEPFAVAKYIKWCCHFPRESLAGRPPGCRVTRETIFRCPATFRACISVEWLESNVSVCKTALRGKWENCSDPESWTHVHAGN